LDPWRGGWLLQVLHIQIFLKIRYIFFLKASDNNFARTVYDCFTESISKYGLPLHVRGDRGSENVLVRDFMLSKRCEGAFISGRSVHNTRIERLWVDVGKVVRP
jgi:hypothetical protein